MNVASENKALNRIDELDILTRESNERLKVWVDIKYSDKTDEEKIKALNDLICVRDSFVKYPNRKLVIIKSY